MLYFLFHIFINKLMMLGIAIFILAILYQFTLYPSFKDALIHFLGLDDEDDFDF